MEWTEFLEQEREGHSKMDYYLAQIASEIRMSNTRLQFKEKSAKDMLLKFISMTDQEAQLIETKSNWAASLGMNIQFN